MRQPTAKQILEWKERGGQNPRLRQDLLAEISKLERLIPELSERKSSALDLVPIKLVTLFEVYSREFVRELVDEGSPYLERAFGSLKVAKIDVAFLQSFDSNKLSIGDLAAHTLSTNTIEGVLSVFEGLIDQFKVRLATAHVRWTEEKDDWPRPAIIDDVDKVIAALSRLLKVRHIVVHELPRERPYDQSELQSFSSALSMFIEACDWLVVEEIYNSVPYTQIQMSMDADKHVKDLKIELEKLNEAANQLQTAQNLTWPQCQDAWIRSAELQADFVAGQVYGGTMYGMVWSSTFAELIEDRIEQVQKMIDDWMG